MARPAEAPPAAPAALIGERLARLSWTEIADGLRATGNAVIPGLLSTGECGLLDGLYRRDDLFRSRIDMARFGFGRGEYKYFAYPLPDLVAAMRTGLYTHLAPLANAWHEDLKLESRFPATHAEYLARCRAAGQARPTPLLLSYVADDYNCLHQDLYGEHVFPLQATVLLSRPGRDFTGGEFVLAEQRPRRQSRVEVVPLGQGDAVLFAVRHRPAEGKRGFHRVNLRHGVSTVRGGHRRTLGIIFHDAA